MRNFAELLLCIAIIFLLNYMPSGEISSFTDNNILSDHNKVILNLQSGQSKASSFAKRSRRSNGLNSSEGITFEKEDGEWTNIDEEVDIVIPKVLQHLQNMGVEYLQLPDITESISVKPLFLTYEAGLFLSNGIIYNIAGINRYGSANMTYERKSFRALFYLVIKNLQFEYNFLIKLMFMEGYGKVIGSLDDTIIFADLDVTMPKLALELNDFRVVSFRNINVELDQIRIVRELTGVILTPITNLFKERITTSISDKLKDPMQLLMDDFNTKDPLELRTFANTLLSGLTGKPKQ